MSLSRLFEARFNAGSHTYFTEINKNLIIPWKPLSITDFIYYSELTLSKAIPPSVIEDEIFRKCVLDETIIRQAEFLPAGIVTTVVHAIWSCSGPKDQFSINEDLEAGRLVISAGTGSVLHEFVDIITKAFPAYTHEQVYEMNYETLIIRTAQAEKRLMSLGLVQEPIKILSKEELEQQKKQPKRKIDAKKLYEQQFNKQQSIPQKPLKPPPKNKEKVGKWWKTSPVLETPIQDKEQINFKEENLETSFAMGWDQIDLIEKQRKMVEEARKTYASLIKELEKRKKK